MNPSTVPGGGGLTNGSSGIATNYMNTNSLELSTNMGGVYSNWNSLQTNSYHPWYHN